MTTGKKHVLKTPSRALVDKVFGCVFGSFSTFCHGSMFLGSNNFQGPNGPTKLKNRTNTKESPKRFEGTTQ